MKTTRLIELHLSDIHADIRRYSCDILYDSVMNINLSLKKQYSLTKRIQIFAFLQSKSSHYRQLDEDLHIVLWMKFYIDE